MRKIKLYCMYSLVGLIQVLNPILSNAQTQNVIPPSPTAAALGKYVDNPVSLYTGKPVINIPLYDLQVKDFTLPISLSYNAGGIQLGEVASNVGLGWSLNAGGVITRAVHGYPDDFCSPPSEEERNYRIGLLRHNRNTINDEYYLNDFLMDIFDRFFIQINSHKYIKKYDSEPDIFYFNFCGIQGKFLFEVIDGSPTIKSVPYQNLIIEHQTTGGEITSFIITDTKGIKYYFNETERTKQREVKARYYPLLFFPINDARRYSSLSSDIDPDPIYNDERITEYNSSWYLKKIEIPNGETILFEYMPQKVKYLNRPIEQSWGFYLGESYNPNIATPNTYCSHLLISSEITEKHLSKIESANTLINFEAQHSRQDVTNSASIYYPKAITHIFIKSYQNSGTTKMKHWEFNYDYFESDTNEDIEYRPGKTITFGNNDNHPDYIGMDVYYKRLRLSSLQEFGETNYVQRSPYTFIYKYDDYTGNSEHKLSHRLSLQRDLWGFYNAASSNNTLIPALYVYDDIFRDGRKFSVYNLNKAGNHHYLEGANRLPNANLMDVGSLTKIIYPTGGYTEYEYEPHTFWYSDNELEGGGIRIKTVTKYDNVSNKSTVYNYKYVLSDQDNKTSGTLISMPVFAEHGLGKYSQLGIYEHFMYGLTSYSVSQSRLGSTQGSRVGYKRVSESISGSGQTVYSFAIPATGDTPKDIYSHTFNYHFPDINVENEIYGFNFDATSAVYDGNSQNNDWFINQVSSSSLPYNGYTLVECWIPYRRIGIDEFDVQTNSSFDLLMNPSPSLIYPYPPSVNYDWNRGQLLLKEYFNDNNILVKKDTFTYDIFYPYGKTSPSEVYGIKIGSFWPEFSQEADVGDGKGYIPHAFTGFRSGQYKYLTDVARVLSSKEERVYDLDDNTKYVSKLTSYTYNNFGQVQTVLTTDSKGDEMKTQYQYPGDYSNYSSINMPDEEYARGIHVARYKNIINKPVETVLLKNNKVTGASLLLYRSEGSLQNGFDLFPYKTYELEWSEPVSDFSYSIIDYEGDILKFSKNFRYKLVNTFGPFDQNHNILQISKNNDLDHSYIWGYGEQYPVAKITNSKIKNSYFQNFENPTNEENISWLNNINSAHQTITSDNSLTGNKSLYVLSSTNMSNYAMSLNLTNAEIDVDKSYTFSAWAWAPVGHDDVNIQFKYFDGASWYNLAKTSYSGNGEWQLLRVTQDFSGFSNVQRIEAVARNYGPNGRICYWDNIRFHPTNAQMTTYTYKPLVGITSETGPDNKTTYYEYDDFGRLTHVKDHNKNIINRYSYHYEGEPVNVTIPDLPDDLEVNKDNLLFNLSGGTQTFEITSKVDWTITFEGDITGLDVTPVSGSGNATIQVTCGAWDPAAPPRIVPLTITGGGLTEEVHVVQVYH